MNRQPEHSSERRSISPLEWFVSLAVFGVGLVIGTLAIGGISLAHLERLACNVALQYGVKIEPRLAETLLKPNDPADTPPEVTLADLSPEEVELLRLQLRALEQTSVASVTTTSSSGRKRTVVQLPTPPPTAEARATLAYWNRMNAVIIQEETQRFSPNQLSAANALQFVNSRAQCAENAARALREIDRQQVDPAVTSLAEEIARWYDRAVELNREAADLLQYGTREARQGTRGTNWKVGEEAHQKQCDEINRRGEEVRRHITSEYKLAFPPLK